MTDFTELRHDHLARHLRKHLAGEVRFDSASRRLYSTDASIYQIEPLGVVVPKTAEDIVAAVQITAEMHVPITPRGGGTSLSGQSIGPGVVLDCSKYLNSRPRHRPRRAARPASSPAWSSTSSTAPSPRTTSFSGRSSHIQPGQPRRHDGQQLGRLALHRLRQDHRPRPPPRRGAGRRQPGVVRPRLAGGVGPPGRGAHVWKAAPTSGARDRPQEPRRDPAAFPAHPAPGQRLQPGRAGRGNWTPSRRLGCISCSSAARARWPS